jgi:hypothetical protein
MDYTKIKLSRGAYTEDSREIAILHLDLRDFSPGEAAIVNYYTDETKTNIDTVFAVGVKSGKGRDKYRIISAGQFIVVWDVVTILPDVSKLAHDELYLYHDTNNDTWQLVYAEDNTRVTSPIPAIAQTYLCLKDNNLYVSSENQKVKRVNDLATEQDLADIIEQGGNADYSIEQVNEEDLPEDAAAAYRLKRKIGDNIITYQGDTIIIPKTLDVALSAGTGISIDNSEISVKIEESGGLEIGESGGLQIGVVEEEKLSQNLQTMLEDIKRKFYAISITASRSGSTIYFTDETLPVITFTITVKDSNGNVVAFDNLELTSNQEGTFSSKPGASAQFIPQTNPQGTTNYNFIATYETVGGIMTATSGNIAITIENTPFYTGTVNKVYSNNLTDENKQECAESLLLNATRNHVAVKPSTTGPIATSITDDIEQNDTIAILSKYAITKFVDANTGFEADSNAFSSKSVQIQNTSGNVVNYYLYVKNTLSTGTANYRLTY